MSTRETFDLELKELKEKLLELGSLAEMALTKAMAAFAEKDANKALEVLEEDVFVDHLEEDIIDRAIILIATQSPFAKDLRRIMVAIKISVDVERMADHAVNIAKETIRIGNEALDVPYHTLHEMAKYCQEMLSMSLKSYVEEDTNLAKNVAELDDKVDQLFGETMKSLTDSKETTTTQIAFIARFLERFADHATNIAEEVLYLVKGIRFELNN